MGTLNIFIVDDHPTMVEAYKSILISAFIDRMEINFTTAYTCEEAYYKIHKTAFECDLALLDFKLPPYESQLIYSGQDLSVVIKNKVENCKIVMLTSADETFTLYELVKNANPDGVLLKSDFTPDELSLAVEVILKGNNYFSQTVKERLKKISEKEMHLDAVNRQIISLLAKGVKTKNLPKYLNISLSSVDKRKNVIKTFFNIEKGTDEDIVAEAKLRGFI